MTWQWTPRRLRFEAHILGKRGTRAVPAADVTFANVLKTFRVAGRVTGARRQRTVNECARLADESTRLPLTGDPSADWLLVRDLFQGATCERLQAIAGDAKYLRLLHRGATLRASLGELWRQQGSYAGAVRAVSDALVQEHFATAQRDQRGIHLMTIHKSKGKEFDEVIVYDGAFHRLLKDPADGPCVAQERLALRVAVTRAIQRATILTPENSRCGFL
jgi:DNA helicase-2/ATP-dependent DNA helicase PcrA